MQSFKVTDIKKTKETHVYPNMLLYEFNIITSKRLIPIISL